MKFQQPLFLENGGQLLLPPNPDMLNTNIPNLRQADVVQLYPLTTKYRFNGKTFVYARGQRKGDAGEYVNAQLIASKGAQAVSFIEIAESSTNIHTHAAGVTEVVVEMAGVTVDEWKYGHIAIGNEDNTVCTSYGILGNTASDIDGYVTVTLDDVLAHATIHDTTEVEVWKSPFATVEWGGTNYEYSSTIGVPMVNVEAGDLDGQWVWLQTWGPCMCKGGDAGIGDSGSDRAFVFDGQGQIRIIGAGPEERQAAGFILEKTKDDYTSLSAKTSHFVMLQIDP